MTNTSIAELTTAVTEAKEAEQDALEAGGEFSRDYVNARDLRQRAERRLSAAQFEAERREQENAKTPDEVAEAMQRRARGWGD